MPLRALAGAGLAALSLALPAMAQDAAPPLGPILVLRQDDVFERSAFGLASGARFQAANAALVAENREIEMALEAEERDLTDRRPGLPAAEFRALSEAFNTKVEGIRAAQEAKSRAIARQRDEDRRRFVQAAAPVLAAIMQEEGALVILDQQTVVLNFDRIDITDAAIARIDAVIGDGGGLPAPDAAPPDAAAPDAAAPDAAAPDAVAPDAAPPDAAAPDAAAPDDAAPDAAAPEAAPPDAAAPDAAAPDAAPPDAAAPDAAAPDAAAPDAAAPDTAAPDTAAPDTAAPAPAP